MLKLNPDERLSATEAYAHPWIQENFNVEPLESKIQSNLVSYVSFSQLITE